MLYAFVLEHEPDELHEGLLDHGVAVLLLLVGVVLLAALPLVELVDDLVDDLLDLLDVEEVLGVDEVECLEDHAVALLRRGVILQQVHYVAVPEDLQHELVQLLLISEDLLGQGEAVDDIHVDLALALDHEDAHHTEVDARGPLMLDPAVEQVVHLLEAVAIHSQHVEQRVDQLDVWGVQFGLDFAVAEELLLGDDVVALSFGGEVEDELLLVGDDVVVEVDVGDDAFEVVEPLELEVV